jgi:hypothetical protein
MCDYGETVECKLSFYTTRPGDACGATSVERWIQLLCEGSRMSQVQVPSEASCTCVELPQYSTGDKTI